LIAQGGIVGDQPAFRHAWVQLSSGVIERIKARIEKNDDLRRHIGSIRRPIADEKSQTEI
jgi:hypothetical protein